MTLPAARVADMHVCPMLTGVVPHVGGPIVTPTPTVLIGMMPAATATAMAVCVGPPDAVAKGSMTVLTGKKPQARMGDTCGHGGAIVVGCMTVLVGG
ncbi:PAAR domain-containing protein [uncultured Tateyamaria sp.]|uniref:PAAR domain-containing protein n=1 Tax=uncultured Tateyamaria sp. TaxID=455651 RepID=UPI00260FA8FD|nr:PAAR domain-containing protein [uncultured Tateyamaria sp.]